MKIYVSYVIQDVNGHKHDSTFINIDFPPFSFTSDPQVHQIMKWAKTEQSKIEDNQKIIITNMYKV